MARQFRRIPCQVKQRLTQKTLLVLLQDSANFDFFNNMDLDTWEIVSFNPESMQACIEITTDSGPRDVTVRVPAIIVKIDTTP